MSSYIADRQGQGTLKTVINALQEIDLWDCVKVIVGGAPIAQVGADEIGADNCVSNAARAVEQAKVLLGLNA